MIELVDRLVYRLSDPLIYCHVLFGGEDSLKKIFVLLLDYSDEELPPDGEDEEEPKGQETSVSSAVCLVCFD